MSLKNCKILRIDVFKFLESCSDKFDFVFAGPPYALGNIDELPVLIFQQKILNEGGWFVLEHTPRNNYEEFEFFRTARTYGTTVFSIFVNRPKPDGN